MAEKGGTTTQSGILYQNSIAALYLGRLLDSRPRVIQEQVKYVRVEAPLHVDDIVVTYGDEHKHFLQVKENVRIGSKAWNDVWQDFNRQYNDSNFNNKEDRLIFWIGNYGNKNEVLKELISRAVGSKSFEEWWDRLTEDQRELAERIKRLLSIDIAGDNAYIAFMKRVSIEFMPPSTIKCDYVPVWMPESNKKPVELFHILRSKAGEHARIRAEFTANSLRESLLSEVVNLEFSTPKSIHQLRESIESCSAVLLQHKYTFGNSKFHAIRPTVQEIVDWVLDNKDISKNTAMLIDNAGMGKTVVLRDTFIELRKRDIDVLAIKADMQLTGIDSFKDLHEQLLLDAPVIESIERLAKINRVAIIIDQIDALSLSLAHDKGTLNTVMELIARLRRIHNVNIVISCREYDLNSDPRLRLFEFEKKFNIPKLSVDEIKEVLSLYQIPYDELSEPTKELLCIPLHLDLFARNIDKQYKADGDRYELFNINTIQDIYELIWQYYILSDSPDNISSNAKMESIYLLTKYMDEKQQTNVPDVYLHAQLNDSLREAVNWLASEGILVNRDSTWTFLHQTFFDYCYARYFIDLDGDIVGSIKESSQGLFERPKIVQVLSLLRIVNRTGYLRDIHALLSIDNLRFHLRDHVIRWFGSISNPYQEEWEYAKKILLAPGDRRILISSMHGNVAWFQYMKTSILPSWFEKEAQHIDTEIVPYLMTVFRIKQTDTVTLLEPYLGKSEKWNDRIRIITSVKYIDSQYVADFYEKYFVDTFSHEGDIYSRMELYDIGLLARKFPKTSCRLIKIVLDKIFDKINQNGKRTIDPDHFDFYLDESRSSLREELSSLENGMFEEAIFHCSREEPILFVELILPWMISVLNSFDVVSKNEYWYPADELAHNWFAGMYKVQNAIIQGLIQSLQESAKRDPDFFSNRMRLLEKIDLRTPQQMIAIIYAGIPEIICNEAKIYLMKDTRRLELGDNFQAYSANLVSVIFPFLERDDQQSLENYINSYQPIYKHRGLDALKWRGIGQLRLLSGIPENLLSHSGKKILRELQRKFPGVELTTDLMRSDLSMETIGSPISLENAKRMSNKDWINAMQKYKGSVEHSDFYKGGSHQLSQVLQSLVKENPKRFRNLFKSIEFDLDSFYISAFIHGFAEAENAPAEWLFQAIRETGDTVKEKIKRPIAWAIKKRISENIPNDIEMFLLNVLYSDEIENEEEWKEVNGFNNPFNRYLNSDKGASYDTLMRIYTHRGDLESLNMKWQLINYATSIQSISLRAGAIYELIYMIKYDRERCLSIFKKLIDGYEILLSLDYSREFLYWSLNKNYLTLERFFKAMMYSEFEAEQQNGAELACIAYISPGALESPKAKRRAKRLVKKAFSGKISWRRGAARIFSSNINKEPGTICKPFVMNLILDEDEKIELMIENIFRALKDEDVIQLKDFIEAYAISGKGFNHSFTEFLWRTSHICEDWTMKIITICLSTLESNSLPVWRMGVEELIMADLNIYQSPSAEEVTKQKAIDTFDVLMELFSDQTMKVLSEWDKR